PRDAEPIGAKARKAVAEWLRGKDVQEYSRTLCVGAASVLESALSRGALTALMWLWTPPMPLRACATADEGLDYCLGRLEAEGVPLRRSAAQVRRETLDRLRKLLWCSSRASRLYSVRISTRSTAAGSLPGLRTGTKLALRRAARAPPKMNPRASMPTIASTCSPMKRSASPSRTTWSARGLARSGVMSRKRIPGDGKSGTSRMSDRQ